jgi:hypothetical protein
MAAAACSATTKAIPSTPSPSAAIGVDMAAAAKPVAVQAPRIGEFKHKRFVAAKLRPSHPEIL